MFRNHPLRWQLALSYAFNSLVTALVLGTVLVLILGDYYTRAEDSYLSAAAQRAVGELRRSETTGTALVAVAREVALTTQTRVKYYDAAHKLLADSGSPRGLTPAEVFERGFSASKPGRDPGAGGGAPALAATGPPVPGGQGPSGSPAPGDGAGPPQGPLPSPGGSGIFGAPGVSGPPSSRVLEVAVAGSALGGTAYVVVGEAPASGWTMLRSVLEGWLLSAVVAVLLAALFGHALSRRMSRPLDRLTQATDRMAEGDLTVRAEAEGGDEIARLAASFNSMAERTEAGVSALRRFVADAAHQLRTPLTALQTELYIARADAGSDVERDRIARATRQASRLGELADNLLRLSRLEAGEEIVLAEVDAAALVSACADAIASRAEQAGLQLEVAVGSEPLQVCTDAGVLRAALENLLDNAVKFTPEGGTVQVGIAPVRGGVSIWVADTGIGIPHEDRESVFERFNRGHNVSAYPGSGVGLAVVSASVGRLGGTVKFEPLGVGTRFEIGLPTVPSATMASRA